MSQRMTAVCIVREAARLSLLPLLLALAPHADAQAVSAMPALDVNRLSGTWYEVARLPNKQEKKCEKDAVTLFAPGDKPRHLQLVSACRTKTGYLNASNQSGKPQDKSGDGKLKLGSFWPFYRKYWVLALGPENQWALIGNPNHKDLWIYSRTITLPPATYADLQSRAAAQGFPLAKLIMSPQTAR